MWNSFPCNLKNTHILVSSACSTQYSKNWVLYLSHCFAKWHVSLPLLFTIMVVFHPPDGEKVWVWFCDNYGRWQMENPVTDTRFSYFTLGARFIQWRVKNSLKTTTYSRARLESIVYSFIFKMFQSYRWSLWYFKCTAKRKVKNGLVCLLKQKQLLSILLHKMIMVLKRPCNQVDASNNSVFT